MEQAGQLFYTEDLGREDFSLYPGNAATATMGLLRFASPISVHRSEQPWPSIGFPGMGFESGKIAGCQLHLSHGWPSIKSPTCHPCAEMPHTHFLPRSNPCAGQISRFCSRSATESNCPIVGLFPLPNEEDEPPLLLRSCQQLLGIAGYGSSHICNAGGLALQTD